jgi:microcin C transport system permease protein
VNEAILSALVVTQDKPARLAPPLPRKGFLRLSPINERRLANFRANERGYWSFWIFMVLFILCLFAEFIANDKPTFLRYEGELLFPVFIDYPERQVRRLSGQNRLS